MVSFALRIPKYNKMERLFKDTKFLESFNTLFKCYNNHLKATVNFQCNELKKSMLFGQITTILFL